MTPDQILLVQTSFEMMGADGTALASTLRSRLASRDLTLRGPLAGTPAEQARLLVLAVRGLSRSRVLRRLRARHDSGRTLENDLATFGVVLVESVEELLGATLPRSVREAWVACHRALTAPLASTTGCRSSMPMNGMLAG